MSSQTERMLEQFAKLERRSLEIESLLSRPEIASNNLEYKRLSKERGGLEGAIALFRAHKKAVTELEGLEPLLTGGDPELAGMAREEQEALLTQIQELESALALELIPKDPNDGRNIILEVRAGAGGDEAGLFAMQLFRMYGRFCERQGWKVEVLSVNETELGGVKEAIALVSGDAVYRALKYESGVHRVQRVPATEAQGRVHTSTVTVAVLPEADDVEVNINENDLRIDTYRASGAGGQHVNRTDSAVRITHIPSGIVVACQDERSQIKNRSRAMKVLQAKLLEQAQIEQDRALSEERRSQVGRGDRSERIRTYNFPQSRVTDHRINRTIHSIGAFMEGDIGEMVEALKAHDQTEALKAQSLPERI